MFTIDQQRVEIFAFDPIRLRPVDSHIGAAAGKVVGSLGDRPTVGYQDRHAHRREIGRLGGTSERRGNDRRDGDKNRTGRTGMQTRIGRFLFLVMGVCACSIIFSAEPTLSNPLFSKQRPWCIGRFVFDRPVASEITDQRYAYWGNKLEAQHNVSSAEYQSKIDRLEKKLRTERRFDPANPRNQSNPVWLERETSPTKYSRVFAYQEGIAKAAKLPFDTEGYIFERNTLFHTTGSFGASGLDKFEPVYTDLYRRIKARDNWSVPTEPGFCFDGGIATGSSTSTEEVSQSFAL
ncbi:hypothetical protein ISO18_33030, partial [Burkholderia pseudomultivorans]|nr:hypothetical protein [Burkholderia pseudomultivorans]